MNTRKHSRLGLTGLVFFAAALASAGAAAQDADPPTRVARVAYTQGSVSLQPGGTQDWVAVPLNRPLTTGDQLWVDQNGRAELQLDGSQLRIGSGTSVSFLNLGNEVTQVQLTSGTLIVRVRRLDDNETYEIDAPNLAFSVLRPGEYRISVDPSGTATSIVVRNGQGEVTGAGGGAYTVLAGESDLFSGSNPLQKTAQSYSGEPDAFDAWSADRDGRADRSESAQYVSPDVVGYQDLDENGSWQQTPDYGYVWYPRAVVPGWAPYRYGHWAYIAPWGYTWVDDAPWGFAPFHYGRWVWWGNAWGWVPTPPRPMLGIDYVRPVYAPALVAWVGVGAGVAWFALGPHDVFVPSYPVSREYVRNVNVSNTVVNTTIVNNVYNNTIVNNRTVNNITYVNRGVPGAVTATGTQAFTTAQPIARNALKLNPREIAAAPVRGLAPSAVPTRQAILGSGRQTLAKPPARIEQRSVVARTTPPPSPPSVTQRLAAIQANGGKPLSMTQERALQPAAAARPAAVRIAPVSMPPNAPKATPKPAAEPAPKATPKPAPEPAPKATPKPAAEPAPAAAAHPMTAVHPRELPPAPKPVSPSEANSALERQHLQQQQQLQAQQEQERQRVQQQQEQEHERQQKQQADAARSAELERQHEQQTQQLQQRHLQQQQELQAQQQKAQQEARQRAQAAEVQRAAPPPERPAGKPHPQSPH